MNDESNSSYDSEANDDVVDNLSLASKDIMNRRAKVTANGLQVGSLSPVRKTSGSRL